ncbi:MAG: hypothetical protein AAF568_07600 [Pseudomonadota bacterium]
MRIAQFLYFIIFAVGCGAVVSMVQYGPENILKGFSFEDPDAPPPDPLVEYAFSSNMSPPGVTHNGMVLSAPEDGRIIYNSKLGDVRVSLSDRAIWPELIAIDEVTAGFIVEDAPRAAVVFKVNRANVEPKRRRAATGLYDRLIKRTKRRRKLEVSGRDFDIVKIDKEDVAEFRESGATMCGTMRKVDGEVWAGYLASGRLMVEVVVHAPCELGPDLLRAALGRTRGMVIGNRKN